MTLRDKFDNLNAHYVKGLTNVNHQRNLETYALDLVAYHADYDSNMYSLCLSDLSDDDQNELVRLYLECVDRDTSECVHGHDLSIDNEYTCALLSMLKDNCDETRERFAEVTRKNVISYYKKSLQLTLDDACETYLLNMENENGFYSHVDQDNGDVVWGKY